MLPGRSRFTIYWEQFPRWCLLLSLAGYPLVAALSAGMELPNRPVSIVMRGAIGVLAIVSIMHVLIGHSLNAVKWHFWVPWTVFWVTYLARMSFDLLIADSARNYPAFDYVAFGIGACLVPAIAAACPKPVLAYTGAHRPLAILALLGLLANGWVIFYVGGLAEIASLSGLRAESEFLNPISIGHLAVTLSLICGWWLVREPPQGVAQKILLVVALLTGLVAMVASGSRGPTVSLVICLAMLGFFERRRMKALPLLAALTIIVVAAIFFRGEIRSSFWFERLSGASFTDETRRQLMADAWELFGQSPIVGAGIDPLVSYPHNLVIEAFMAGGLVTGLAFCALILSAGFDCIRVWRDYARLSWIPMLFIQYLVGAMLSGSLYYSAAFWVLMAAVVSVSQHIDESPPLFRVAAAGAVEKI
jgi:O-antigen ligase